MRARLFDLPYLTADLPGTGGTLRASDDDFRVAEVPAYAPEGTGDHVFVHIEKRGLTTPVAAETIARALDLPTRDVGWAGMKDRHAVTRQWLSLPPPADPDAARALDLPGITVLDVARHRHKLRTGHLRGNHFTITVRATESEAEAAAAAAAAVLARLVKAPGSPNWFGPQRFGRDGDNAEQGLALVRGRDGARSESADPAAGRQQPAGARAKPRSRSAPRGRQKRLFISALQSALFNQYLKQRIEDGLFAHVIAGDILQKPATGGLFETTEPELDQTRLEAGEVVPTGPMFGYKLRTPTPDSAAAGREQAVLTDADLELADFARVGKLGTGTRRAVAIQLTQTDVRAVAEHAIALSFTLPAGAYATAVLREVVKGPNPFPG